MKKRTKLNELYATAISGNNILSTALYVTSVAMMFSGIYAPFVLSVVALTLFFYRYIYIEIVEALPVNGGVYTCLLNSTSKIWASISGVLIFLAYIASAVISAKVAIEYVNTVIDVPVLLLTMCLLLAFAILVITGITESAKVAVGIFFFHIVTLISFLVLGIISLSQRESLLVENFLATQQIIFDQNGIFMMLILAFSACLLGVTGFESSANFVEEQRKWVFRKTLRNMLIGAALFNPLISLVMINIIPIEVAAEAKEFLLAVAAEEIGGTWYKYIIVIDAFLVLSGAVLASYIGVNGLISRMSLDNCLPRFLSIKNKKGSYPYIALGFFLLSASVVFITKGDLIALAGVYTISFLSVMSLYALGNAILKTTRQDLKRTMYTPKTYVVLGFLSTTIGLVGNIFIEPYNLVYFMMYFVPSAILVVVMVYKSEVLRAMMRLTHGRVQWLHDLVYRYFSNAIEGRFVAFIQKPSRIFQTLDYIHKNEVGQKITFVYCSKEDKEQTKKDLHEIKELLPCLKKAGVFPQFEIRIIHEREPFSPKTVTKIARELKIHKNRILIGTLHDSHKYDYDAFGGVRIIF